MLNKLWSLLVIRLCGLLPISYKKPQKKFIISKLFHFWSCIICIGSAAGSIYRYYYVNVADDYQTEPNKIGYIFDILLKIEPLIVVTALFLMQYPVVNFFELRKSVNFLNCLQELFDSTNHEKFVRKDHFTTIVIVSFLTLWIGSLEFFFQSYNGLVDLSRHFDVIINFVETIIVTFQSLKFIVYFEVFLIAATELENNFMLLVSSDFHANDKNLLKICLKKYDVLLDYIKQFIKIHGFYVKVLVVYAYFDVVAAFKGFLDVAETYFGENKGSNNTTVEDIVMSFWYLCHTPYLLWLIHLGESIENKVILRFISHFHVMMDQNVLDG